jgi:hypothetical protein
MLEILPIEYLRAILLLGIATIVWIAIKFHHKYADRSLEWLEGIVEGYAITAFFWSGMISLSVIAIHYHLGWVLHLMLLMRARCLLCLRVSIFAKNIMIYC